MSNVGENLVEWFEVVRVALDALGQAKAERDLSPAEQIAYDSLCRLMDIIEWEACQCPSES